MCFRGCLAEEELKRATLVCDNVIEFGDLRIGEYPDQKKDL
jgi:hypothetical protein